MTHTMELTYTTDDDGIHLTCSCGFDQLLGFRPSPAAVWWAALQHDTAGTLRSFKDEGIRQGEEADRGRGDDDTR